MPTSPYFPIPAETGGFDAPLLTPIAQVLATRAGHALNRGRESAPAVSASGRLLHMGTDLEEALGRRGHIIPAGDWWLVLGSDNTGVFVDTHPKRAQRWIQVAPIPVRLAKHLTWGGIRRPITPLDLTDPLENPGFPDAFAQALKATVQVQMEAWAHACAQALPLDGAWPPRSGAAPVWFGRANTTTEADKADLQRFCAGLSLLMTAQTGAWVPVSITGATPTAWGQTKPADILAKPPTTESTALLRQARAALHSPAFFWPQERRIAQHYQGSTRWRSLRAAIVARSPSTPPASRHAAMALMHDTQAWIAQALGQKVGAPAPAALHPLR